MKRILIVKTWALGDILVATPLLTALKDKFPDCSIRWLVDSSYEQALANNPLIDEVIAIDWRRWQADFRRGNIFRYITSGLKIRQHLKTYGFDIVISLIPDKWWSLWFNTARQRVGLFPSSNPKWLKYFYTDIITRTVGSADHHIDRNLQPMRFFGAEPPFDRRIVYAVTQKDKDAATKFLKESIGEDHCNKPYIVFHPGTSQKTKCWPSTYFSELADLLQDDFYVVITGSPAEQELAQSIIAHTKSGHKTVSAAGELSSLAESAAIVAGAKVVVTGDTSIVHIASALNVPTIAVYGSTRPNEYKPLGDNNILLFDNSLECSPCYKSTCPLNGDAHLRCLHNITPSSVYKGIQELLLTRSLD